MVIDVYPKGKEVALCRLRHMWGFSYRDWTPVALGLEFVFEYESTKDPIQFKKRFAIPEQEGDRLCTFLYLQAGIESGRWVFGPVGYVNGALLRADAFQYFVSVLPRFLQG